MEKWEIDRFVLSCLNQFSPVPIDLQSLIGVLTGTVDFRQWLVQFESFLSRDDVPGSLRHQFLIENEIDLEAFLSVLYEYEKMGGFDVSKERQWCLETLGNPV
ncbi:MAG: hypothetical protein ACYCTV_03415 [Leptospirales bacterium]